MVEINQKRYINPHSDGRFYTEKDMARTFCNDCRGCHACCSNMGDSIRLDPYDIWQLAIEGRLTFSEMMEEGKIAFTVENGMLLPYLAMRDRLHLTPEGGEKQEQVCSFLDEKGRCSVHSFRPGICRLFPMGRDFTSGELSYILLDKLCPAPKSKIKVEKWLDIANPEAYRKFVIAWHDFRRKMQEMLCLASQEEQKQLNMYLINMFYACDYLTQTEASFYQTVEEKMTKVYRAFGI